MGFYSIYKIFKDMLRTIFGNKILKIIIIFILIFSILFVYNKCFAFTNDIITIPNVRTSRLSRMV